MNWKQFLTGSAWVLFSSVAARISGAVTSVLVARMLGPDGLGELSLVRDISVLTVPILTFGISQAVVRAISAAGGADDSKSRISKILGTLGVASIAMSVAAPVLILLAASPISNFYNMPQLYPIVQVLALVVMISIPYDITNAVLTGLEEFRVLAVRQLISAVLSPVIIYVCVLKGGVAGAVAASGIVNLILVLLLLSYLRRSDWLRWSTLGRPSLGIFWSIFMVSLPLLGSMIIMRPLNLIGSSTLVLHAGVTELGWFRVAYSIYGLTMVVPEALKIPLLPMFSKIGDNEAIREQGLIILRVMMAFATPLFAIGILFSNFFTVLLFGSAFSGACGVVALMLIVGFLAVTTSTLETNLISQGKTFTQFRVNILNAALFIGAVYLLVPRFGHWGLATTYMVTELGAFCLYVFVLLRHSKASFRSLARAILISWTVIGSMFAYAHLAPGLHHVVLHSSAVLLAFLGGYLILDSRERGIVRQYVTSRQISHMHGRL